MIKDTLFQLLLLKHDADLDVQSLSVEWRNAEMLGWPVAMGVAVLCLFAWWTYPRRALGLTRIAQGVLILLRSLLLVLLLGILLRPVLVVTFEKSLRRLLVCLIDNSNSMAITDHRVAPEDLQRAKLYGKSQDPANEARFELIKDALNAPDLHLLPDLQKKFDLIGFGFSDRVSSFEGAASSGAPENWVEKIVPSGPRTAIGSAIQEILNQPKSQPMAGILLVTDGWSNSGDDQMDAARQAKEAGIPLYIYGVGVSTTADIEVSGLVSPETAFVEDRLKVTVHICGKGYERQKGRVVLKLGAEIIADRKIELKGGDGQIETFEFTPKKTGDFELSASVPPRGDEVVKDNNSISRRLKVINDKIRVLLVENSPRLEFRHLKNTLINDPRIDFKCLLFDVDPALCQIPNSPYLPTFPATKGELAKYDLVIIGDVASDKFTSQQLNVINEWVAKFGGSLISIAGRYANPVSFRATALEKMLPIEWTGPKAKTTSRNSPAIKVNVALTPAGRTNAMLSIAPTNELNVARWSVLPALEWLFPEVRPKPGAQVLLESRGGNGVPVRTPVMVFQQYGAGHVLYIGTDNTWRWRKNEGLQDYEHIWSAIAQQMGMTHLIGGSRQVQLSLDRQNYVLGEPVNVDARILDENFNPLKNETVDVTCRLQSLAGQETKTSHVMLRAVPSQPGAFRGSFIAGSPESSPSCGTYQLALANDSTVYANFEVIEDRLELREPGMNEPALKAMAVASGGAFFREENLTTLASMINAENKPLQFSQDVELWATPLSLLLLTAMAMAEWILRRYWRLK